MRFDNEFFIDEVESLAAARKAALSGNEPSDSIRVSIVVTLKGMLVNVNE
jgi:hypothetical protein